MTEIFKKYGYTPDKEEMNRTLDRIAESLSSLNTPEILKECFSMMDLTSLKSDDTPASILKLVEKVNSFATDYPSYPLPASICVYPNFASVVRKNLKDASVHVTAVAGCFPSSQSFTEVKVRECELAVLDGADEIDIVLALNSFLADNWDAASDEIRQIRKAVDAVAASQGRTVHLKVILETGLLKTDEAIAAASFLAMEAGADFIKTSTGKVDVNATPSAAYVMCRCIAAYYKATGRKVGFKPAGGISSAKDALCYYSIVYTVLGKDWLCKDLFRFGVSRMANNIISEVEKTKISYF
ncbi:MAG: deoxyribose-phosphate aldolase [Candidatus Cryptobacteroides sp.]